MALLAHAVPDEQTLFDRLVHPFTGIDHLVAIALVAVTGVALVLSLRGHLAATTARTTTRVRSRALVIGSATAFALSLVLLVTV
jgi:hydrogenase/urease accessory protein HupE